MGQSLCPIYRTVNIRNKGRANLSDISDINHMNTLHDISGLRTRLVELLDQKGITMRAASVNANLGPGYVHSVVKDGQEPTVAKLAAICAANDISFSYVVLGVDVSPETKRLLEMIGRDEKARDGILALLGDRLPD
jgi:transcriptional regulator with XRE-family HTH domain